MEENNLSKGYYYKKGSSSSGSKMGSVNYEDVEFPNEQELQCNANLGPEFPHSHTCVHMHTKIVAPPTHTNDHDHGDSSESSRKREWERGGNRDAVRKYRQKKKAYTASLANELVSLRASNQQLMQRLQSRAGLEAEIARLKCLLADIRGRIEGEIGSFPYQKPPLLKTANMYQNIPNTNFPTSTNIMACNEDGKCGQDCEFQNLNCMAAALRSPSSFN